MNIFFAINSNYVMPLCVALTSILENNEAVIHFFILNSSLTNEDKAKINKVINSYSNAKLEFVLVDDSAFSKFSSNINYISQEAYFRYLIPSLKQDIDKALYLDADLVVNSNIKPLYDIDVKDYYCAGVRDLFINSYKVKIGLKSADLYINSGVMLLNCKKLREDAIEDKLFENNIKYNEVAHFQDQDIINITFKGKIKELDSIYNFATYNVKTEEDKLNNAVIIHLTGEFKPWLDNCWNKLKPVWVKYYETYLNKFANN